MSLFPHLCHWPGCSVEIPPRMWACPKHWFKLSKRMQLDIFNSYRPGEPESPTYKRVLEEFRDFFSEHYKREP